jgi:hypothetical protein
LRTICPDWPGITILPISATGTWLLSIA